MGRPNMRFIHSSIVRSLITLVISGCVSGTGPVIIGVSGGDGGNGSGAPPVLSFFVQPNTANAGQVISPAVEVVAQDSLGATDTTFTGTVSIGLTNNSTGASLSGTTSRRAVNGITAFDDLRVDKAGTYTLQASTSGAAAVTSTIFSITTVNGQ